MYREKVRTIGISLLGGNTGVEGAYELGIDSIRAVNEEDVTAEPRTSCVAVPLRSTASTIVHRKRAYCRHTVAETAGIK